MPMRWRCPPEKLCGYRPSHRGSSPVSDMSPFTLATRDAWSPIPWMTSGSLTMSNTVMRGSRELNGSWEDELDARPEADELPIAKAVEAHRGAVVVEHDRAFVGVHRPHDHLAHGGLAAPALPDETEAFPAVDAEAHPVDGPPPTARRGAGPGPGRDRFARLSLSFSVR